MPSDYVPVLASRGVLVLSKKQAERVDAALKLIGSSLDDQFPNCDILEYDVPEDSQ